MLSHRKVRAGPLNEVVASVEGLDLRQSRIVLVHENECADDASHPDGVARFQSSCKLHRFHMTGEVTLTAFDPAGDGNEVRIIWHDLPRLVRNAQRQRVVLDNVVRVIRLRDQEVGRIGRYGLERLENGFGVADFLRVVIGKRIQGVAANEQRHRPSESRVKLHRFP